MKKKGFTLIELLAVIVILAIIALITVSTTLNIINNARNGANEATAYALIEAANLYKAESMMDISKEEKIKNFDNIFDDVSANNKPESGELYLNTLGQTALKLVLNDVCYLKKFNDKDISKKEVNNCDLGYIGEDNTIPNVTITKSISSNKNVFQGQVEPIESPSGYSYQWYRNDLPIEEEGLELVSDLPGIYKLEVTTGVGIVSASNEITINTYNIVYDLNEGIGTIDNQVKVEDIAINITTINPTRENYRFKGWESENNLYNSGSLYTLNSDITLHAVWELLYDGLTNKTYAVGENVNYENIEFQVVKDNGDTVTLITKSNVSTGAYGNSTTFNNSTVYNYLNTTWVNNNTKIKDEITKGGIVLDSNTNSYVRLIKKEELSSDLANASNTPFWTMTSSGSNIWYALSNSNVTYQNYTQSNNTSGTCYSGSDTSLDNITKNYTSKKLSSTDQNTLVLPTVSTAIASVTTTPSNATCYSSYSSSTSTFETTCQSCDRQCECHENCGTGCGFPPDCFGPRSCSGGCDADGCWGDYVCSESCSTSCIYNCQDVCTSYPCTGGYTSYYATGSAISYVSNYTINQVSKDLGYRAVINVKKK